MFEERGKCNLSNFVNAKIYFIFLLCWIEAISPLEVSFTKVKVVNPAALS